MEKFDAFVLDELRVCVALLLFLVLDLGAGVSDCVYETDSSSKGFAVLQKRCGENQNENQEQLWKALV